MSNVKAVVHAKGSSNRVFRKNFRLINGVPLYLIQAINLANILPRNNIYIDSDDIEILHAARMNGFSVIKRSAEYANNGTGGVQLLSMFLDKIQCDIVIQAFPPAPYFGAGMLKSMLDNVASGKYLSSMLIKTENMYLWQGDSPLYGFSEVNEIPNSVDLDPTTSELPTLYIVNSEEFKAKKIRTPAPCYQHEAGNLACIDIDYEDDAWFAKAVGNSSLVKREFCWRERCRTMAPPILFLDVDGTLSDGFYNSSVDSELFKSFSTLDGTAIKEIANFGVRVCMVTASGSEAILEQRASIIGVDLISNVHDKVSACESYAQKLGYSLGESAFIGNDVNDLLVLEACGMPLCPSDSVLEVKNQSSVLNVKGGYGVCRSFIEMLKTEKYENRNFI